MSAKDARRRSRTETRLLFAGGATAARAAAIAAIDRAQLLVQPAVLFRAVGYFFQQAMRVNADPDVPDHRLDRFKVGV